MVPDSAKSNIERRANRKAGVTFQHHCVECGKEFTSHVVDTKFCSSGCVGRFTARGQSNLKKTVLCVDCGVPFEVPFRSTRTTRCPQHMAAWRVWYNDRRNFNRRNEKRAFDGEGPWSDWVVFGPTYDFDQKQWIVNLAHKRAPNKKMLTQAEYLLSVHLGRKIATDEIVSFIDGDSENLSITNLKVSKKRSK